MVQKRRSESHTERGAWETPKGAPSHSLKGPLQEEGPSCCGHEAGEALKRKGLPALRDAGAETGHASAKGSDPHLGCLLPPDPNLCVCMGRGAGGGGAKSTGRGPWTISRVFLDPINLRRPTSKAALGVRPAATVPARSQRSTRAASRQNRLLANFTLKICHQSVGEGGGSN